MRKTLLAILLLSGCALAPYSQESVDAAAELRDQSAAVMALAVRPFADYKDSVALLRSRLDAALTVERGRPDNSESVRQWILLTSPSGALLGGFLTRWEANSTLGQLFVNEKRTQVMRAFAIIIATEEAKR